LSNKVEKGIFQSKSGNISPQENHFNQIITLSFQYSTKSINNCDASITPSLYNSQIILGTNKAVSIPMDNKSVQVHQLFSINFFIVDSLTFLLIIFFNLFSLSLHSFILTQDLDK
jgi:hypothetical protein